MVDWKDPEVMAICAVIFTNVSHVGIGAYLFEALQSVGYEWSVITGKRKFRTPMLLYFFTKWMLVASFVGMLVAMNSRSKLQCQALYTFNQFGGLAAIGGSSLLLMLRSLAIHKRHKWMKYPFILLACAHIGVLAWGVTTVRASWVDSVNACVVESVGVHDLAAVYFVTLATDTIVMIVTVAGLGWSRGNSGLWNMLWDQGMIYFATAVVANSVPAVVLLIDLNPVMNIMFSIPAIAVTATVATRCFVTLSEYANRGDESTSGIISSTHNANPWTKRLAGPTTVPGPGIVHKHAQQIQFVRQVERTPHIDTIGAIMANDIVLDAISPTKTLGGSDDSSSNHTPYAFNEVQFDKAQSSKEAKDFV